MLMHWSYCNLALSHQCIALQWHHNGHDRVSNHQPHDCLLNRLFRRRSKKTSKLRATGLCAGNSPGTSEFPTQMASNMENVSIWWRHHGVKMTSAGYRIDQNMMSQWTLHSSPSLMSYGMFFVSIVQKNDLVIRRFDCITSLMINYDMSNTIVLEIA